MALWREMFSCTTMAPSTRFPTPMANPAKVMVLIPNPFQSINVKVANKEMGMAILTVPASLYVPKKANRMRNANSPPINESLAMPRTRF
jgi:hypothetical protein